jgi:hypothetical protein
VENNTRRFKMAITQTVYSPEYPNNSKTVTVDIVSRIPLGAEGDEKFVLYVYTSAYSNKTSSTAIAPIYMYEMRRGWAQSFPLSSPITVSGSYTLQVAIDEADSGYVELDLTAGSQSVSVLAADLQYQLWYAAVSGTKAEATNKLSYLNAQVKYEDGCLLFLSGSTRQDFNNTDRTKASSVQITGGTGAENLGFTTGYPNSWSLASGASNSLHGPASAHVSLDDAVRFGLMSIVNQIDFS